MKADPNLVGITELADAVGMERGRAASILRAAGLQRDMYKRWPRQKALEVLNAATDPALRAANHSTGVGSHVQSSAVSDYSAARAATEAARTEKIRLENDLRSGKLIARDDVIKAGVEFARTVCISLLAIPAKIAPRLVGKTAGEVAETLDAELRNALTDLADFDAWALGLVP